MTHDTLPRHQYVQFNVIPYNIFLVIVLPLPGWYFLFSLAIIRKAVRLLYSECVDVGGLVFNHHSF